MLSDWFQIDYNSYDVMVTSITETATVLYSDNTGRTISQGARMTLDPLGTFIGHKVTVRRKKDNLEEYDNLYNYVVQPRYDGVHVKIVHDQSTIEYDAYISTAERELQRIDEAGNKVYWKEMTLNIVPMEAQVLPL